MDLAIVTLGVSESLNQFMCSCQKLLINKNGGGQTKFKFSFSLCTITFKYYFVKNPTTQTFPGGDKYGGMHTNEKLYVKLITIGCNGPYEKRKRSDLNPSRSI